MTIIVGSPQVEDISDADGEVIELDSWHVGQCGMCGMDELDAHEYSDGTIEVVCAHCGAHHIEDSE